MRSVRRSQLPVLSVGILVRVYRNVMRLRLWSSRLCPWGGDDVRAAVYLKNPRVQFRDGQARLAGEGALDVDARQVIEAVAEAGCLYLSAFFQ